MDQRKETAKEARNRRKREERASETVEQNDLKEMNKTELEGRLCLLLRGNQ